MSQAGLLNSSGTPVVPTTYVTDSGNASPVGNILNVVTPGGGTESITTSGAGNTITISLPNNFVGTGNTIGAVTDDVVTIPLGAVAGTYTFDIKAAGFEAAGPRAVGYTLVGAVRTDGAAATLIPGQTLDEFEEDATIDPATVNIVVAGNNAIIRVTGVALLTIDWAVSGSYVFVS